MPLTDSWREALADDLDPQVAWRRVQAKVLALRGASRTPRRLAREAIELAAGTDFLDLHARAIEDLVEVMRAGRSREALDELEPAIRLHDQKGNTVGAARTRALRDLLASRSRSRSSHAEGPVGVGRGAWRRLVGAWNAIDPCEIVLIEPRADRAPDYARHSPDPHALLRRGLSSSRRP